MKLKNLKGKDDQGNVIIEIEEVDAPVAEIVELLKAGIIETVKNIFKKESQPK